MLIGTMTIIVKDENWKGSSPLISFSRYSIDKVTVRVGLVPTLRTN